MGDREAFTKFLGEEVRVITAGIFVNVNMRCPGADKKRYADEMMPLQDVLYHFVRCTLAHEGRVGENVEFAETDELYFEVNDNKLILGGEILRRLLMVPQFAPENAAEFPQVAEMSQEVTGLHLFGQRRDEHAAYLSERQRRLDAFRSLSTP